jgi:hypothetical protein
MKNGTGNYQMQKFFNLCSFFYNYFMKTIHFVCKNADILMYSVKKMHDFLEISTTRGIGSVSDTLPIPWV